MTFCDTKLYEVYEITSYIGASNANCLEFLWLNIWIKLEFIGDN